MVKAKKPNTIGRLFFFIGVAHSGKSTLARRWQNYEIDIHYNTIRKHVGTRKIPRIIISSDWLRLGLTGQAYVQELEEMVHALKLTLIRTYINQGYDCLVDGTHTTKTSIEALLHIDKEADFYFVDTPAEACKYRAKETNQDYLIEQ